VASIPSEHTKRLLAFPPCDEVAVTKDDDEAATPRASGTVAELVAWIRGQIGQLRKLAQDCTAEVGHNMAGDQYEDGSGTADRDDYPSYPWGVGDAELAYMAATQPRYALALCDTRANILNQAWRIYENNFSDDPTAYLFAEEVIRQLGLAYQHCPGYQDSWRL
jgi:hypothetical protein